MSVFQINALLDGSFNGDDKDDDDGDDDENATANDDTIEATNNFDKWLDKVATETAEDPSKGFLLLVSKS